MRFLYDFFFFIFSLAYLPSFFLKGKHRHGFSERFGSLPKQAIQALSGRKVIWVHGVSVGEVVLAVRLAQGLHERFPGHTVVLTTTTPAGREVAEKSKSEHDFVFYLPIDFSGCVRRFFRSIQPKMIVVLETEIWPNVVWEANRSQIPVWIVNGRLSDRAFKRYMRFRFLMKPVLRGFEAIGVQDATMRERFIRLGADSRRVEVTGQLKFDWEPKTASDSALESVFKRMHPGELFWIIAGSTHEGEEEMLIAVFRQLLQKYPRVRLAFAPRHLNRVAAIQQGATEHKIALKKVSTFSANSYDDSRKDAAILMIDSMGVLASFYEVASVAFIGGSLVPVGGHNPIEPAYFGKPVLFGPHMQNFAEMARCFVAAKAAFQVRDRAELQQRLEEFISGEDRVRAMGAAAKALLEEGRGALDKNLHLLERGVKK